MHPLHLVYLVRDAGGRAAFFDEHARRSAELGHEVTVVDGSESVLPRADFLIATGADSAVRAIEEGEGLPLHWVLDPPRAAPDPDVLERTLRRSSFKITMDARIQQQLQTRYQSRCWCLPDPVNLVTDRRITPLTRDAWRVLVVGDASAEELTNAFDAIGVVRERGFPLSVARLSGGPLGEIETMSGQLDRWLGDAGESARRAVYRNVDLVLVVGSDAAGFGAEAMAHGPCVLRLDASPVTSTGSEPASFDDGALHLPRADSPSAADALAEIFSDRDLRRRLSSAARRAAGHRGWAEHFDRFHAVLGEIQAAYGTTYGRDRRRNHPLRSLRSALLDRQIDFAESLVGGRHVTVIGCGRTDIAVRLAEHGADAVTALEPSDVSLAYQRRHRAHPNVWYEKLGPTLELGPTDVVIALDPLARNVDAATVARAAAAGLNPGGALLLSAPAGDAPESGADPSLAFATKSWLEHHLSLLKESFQKVIPLGQRDAEGDFVIGPDHVAPESLSYLLLAIHPTVADPPDSASASGLVDIRDVHTESRKRRRAA